MALHKLQKKWLENLSKGDGSISQFDFQTLQGLKLIHTQDRSLLCSFRVTSQLSDGDGNWHVGAIAAMVDMVGAMVAASATGSLMVTVDFNISYVSTAKIQEEVEVEAKIVGDVKEKLTTVVVVVEVRRKVDGSLIALARQRMASSTLTRDQQLSKL